MPLLKRGQAPVVDAPALVPAGIVTTSTEAPAGAVKTAAPAAKADNNTMSKAEWHDKDVRISRQGLFQAALNSVGILQLNTGNTFEDYMKLVEQAADRGLAFVNRRD
jgi:hypothetical protein